MERDRYFAFLLRILPTAFRERHGEELMALLEQMKRDLGPRPGALALLRLYVAVTWDVVRQALRGEARDSKRYAAPATLAGAVGSFGQDLRYAARFLIRNKPFAAVAIGTLALGIGANTAIYSLLSASLLRSPAVRDAESLVAVYTTGRRGEPRSSSSYPDYLDYRDRASSLADLAALSTAQVSLGGDDLGGTTLVRAELVTGNYFSILGVAAQLGRVLQPADDEPGAGAPVALLSGAVWRDRFGGDPAIVGRTIRLNGRPVEIVGVVSGQYRGLALDRVPDLWVPMQTGGDIIQYPPTIWSCRGCRLIPRLVGRLAPEATIEQSLAELQAVSEGMREESPLERGERTVTVEPLGRLLLPVGAEEDLPQFVWLLMGVAAATLLLGCSNLANLLLARASARRGEIGVRLAIGAGRGRLVGQLLTESLLLSVLGGAVGLLVAVGSIRLLGAYELPGGLTISALGGGLDLRMLAVAAMLAVVTALACGLTPALQATRQDPFGGAHRGRGAGGGRGSARLRRALVAVQVALCFVLLAGSGLFLRSLHRALGEDLGFQARRVALTSFSFQGVGYSGEQSNAFLEELRRRLDGDARVASVGIANVVPFADASQFRGTFAAVQGYTPAPDEEMRVEMVFASTGYFDALGVPILAGRSFGEPDSEGAERVAVVSRSMAERYWPEGDAVGGFVQLRPTSESLRVVGVVADVAWESVGEAPESFVYLPMAQHVGTGVGPVGRLAVVAARTHADPHAFLPALRQEIQALEPDLSLWELSTMEEAIGAQLMPQRVGAVLLTAFGLLALILSSVGIVGVVSYSVREQRRAIGVRIALGAERGRIVRQAAQGMMPPIMIGLAAGLAGALLVDDAVERFLFGISAGDPMTYGAIAAALAAVALGATLLPASRAASVDPLQVLQAE